MNMKFLWMDMKLLWSGEVFWPPVARKVPLLLTNIYLADHNGGDDDVAKSFYAYEVVKYFGHQ